MKKISKSYRRTARQHRPVRKFIHRKLVNMPQKRCRTVFAVEKVAKMVYDYHAGFSMRDLAHRYHCAIPIVKRTLMRAYVQIKPQGRPRKEAVA